MKIKNNIIIIILILTLCTYMINMFYIKTKELNASLPEVKLKEKAEKNKTMAIMISNDGVNYYEYESDMWPGNSYKFKDAKCIDNKGGEVKEAVTYDDGKITLTTNKTVYCTVYFDYKGTLNILRENDPNKVLSSEEVGGMYRYQGLYTDDVRNYICLGEYCCKTIECSADTNDNMYRIIGINSKGELKVIKKTALTNYSLWWSINTEDIKWPQSQIYQMLNGKSEESYNPNLNDPNSYYYSLNSKLQSLIISNHTWLYGDNQRLVETAYNSNIQYAIESGIEPTSYLIKNNDTFEKVTKIWDESIEAPIGIMYIHDYLFAYPDGNPQNGSNALKSWIHLNNNELNHPVNNSAPYEWLMTRLGRVEPSSNMMIWRIASNGEVSATDLYAPYYVRPVFFISSNIKITGDGTLTNPFEIF